MSKADAATGAHSVAASACSTRTVKTPVFGPRPGSEWMTQPLACRDWLGLFYSRDEIDQQAAIAICRICPVIAECRQDVEEWPEELRDVGMVAGGVYWPSLRPWYAKKKADWIDDDE